MEIIDQKIIYQKGFFKRIRQWIRGWGHRIPDSLQVWGLTGQETLIDREVFVHLHTFFVLEKK